MQTLFCSAPSATMKFPFESRTKSLMVLIALFSVSSSWVSAVFKNISSIFLAENKVLSSDEDRGELGALGWREQLQENNKTNAIDTRQPRCFMTSLPDILIRLSQIFQRLSGGQFSLYNSFDVWYFRYFIPGNQSSLKLSVVIGTDFG